MSYASWRSSWTPPRVRTIACMTLSIFACCAFDALSTLHAVSHPHVEELNPLMRWALSVGPNFFVAFKTSLTLSCIALIAAFAKTRRLAWWGLCGLTATYGALIAYQIFVLVAVIRPS